jgi:lipoyl(octanoyl) transferase
VYVGGVRGHIRRLEEAAIRLLGRYGVAATRREGFPGVWAGADKIASIGVYVARSVAMHGVAVNLAPQLEDFELIVPCGLAGVRMTSVQEIRGWAPPIEQAALAFSAELVQVFDGERTVSV